jgi:hypothetical protein
MSRGRALSHAWALSCAAAIGLAAAVAGACGNDIRSYEDPHVAIVINAQIVLGTGHYNVAVRAVRIAFSDVEEASATGDLVARKGLRIVALACARSLGAVLPSGAAATTPAERAQSLEWAVRTLRHLAAVRKDQPWPLTDLAEALARIPASRAEAKAILEGLAQREVVSSAEGYATLAALRAEQGDTKGREEALARCKPMTLTPNLCRAPAATVLPGT